MTTRADILIVAKDLASHVFDHAGRGLDVLAKRADGVAVAFGRLGALGAAVGAGLVALQGFQGLQILDQLDDLAEKTGIGVERLSELRYAGEAVGTPLDVLTGGIGRLSKLMAEAAGGNKQAVETFKALGVEVSNADGSLRSSDEVLGDLAEKFAGYEDGAAKAALAQRIFGKSGADMIPLLNQGRQGLAELSAEARALGAVYDEDAAKAVAQFNDNLGKIKIAAEAAAIDGINPLIKSLASLSSEYINARKEGLGFWDSLMKADREWSRKTFGWGGTARERQADAARAELDARDAVRRLEAEMAAPKKKAAPVIADGGGAKTPKISDAERYLENLQQQLQAARDLSAAEKLLEDIQAGRLGRVTAAQQRELMGVAQQIDAAKARTEAEKEAEKAWQDGKKSIVEMFRKEAEATKQLEEQAKALARSVETPIETLNRELDEIAQAVRTNPGVNGELQARLESHAWKKFADGAKDAGDRLDEFGQRMAQNVQDMLGNSLYEAAKGNFDNILEGFVDMLLRMVAQAQAADLARALFGTDAKGNLGGGWLGRLAGAFGSWLGGAAGASSAAPVGGTGMQVPAGFAADGFHASGLDYVPFDGYRAVLHKGERVQTAAEARAGMQVQVNNYGSDEVQARQGADGAPVIDIVRREAVRAVAADGRSGGQTARALGGRFGLNNGATLSRRRG